MAAGEAPIEGRRARFRMPVQVDVDVHGGRHIVYGGFGPLWGGRESHTHSSVDDSSTQDQSYATWGGGDAGDPDDDASIASLASSVACSAIEDQSVGGEETPSVLLCPLTGEMMRDPVATVDGQVYERTAITAWLEKHDVSPLTGEVLPMKLLIPSLPLRAMISEILEKRKLRRVNAHSAAWSGLNFFRSPPTSIGYAKPPSATRTPAPVAFPAVMSLQSSVHNSSDPGPSVW